MKVRAHSKRELQYYKLKGMEAKLIKRKRNKFYTDNCSQKQYMPGRSCSGQKNPYNPSGYIIAASFVRGGTCSGR